MASVLQMILEFRDRSVLGRNHNFNQNTNHNSPYLYLSVLTTVISIYTLCIDNSNPYLYLGHQLSIFVP